MLTATAVARIRGSTTFTIIELMGLVEANRQSSASTIALQYTAGGGAVRATNVRGAAASVPGPDSQRYGCRERESSRSPSQAPANVPRNPVAPPRAPNCTAAGALERPRVRASNEGGQNASAPVAA